MLLSKLIASNEGIVLSGDDVAVTGLTEDSRKVVPGCLFIATPGVKQDGSVFINDAIARGAAAVLVAENAPAIALPVPVLRTRDVRAATSALAATFYPRQPATIAAVTGTSGKTSTAQFARELWQHMGHTSASIGTLGLVNAHGSHYGSLTTPDAITMHRLLDESAGDGVTHVAVEASSHGIEFKRLDHVRLKAAAFTNLSRDHLDYHQTMEAYLAAKLRLFDTLLPEGGAAVLNADIPEYETLAKVAAARRLHVITFGKQGKELRLLDAAPDARGLRLKLTAFGRARDVLLPVMGGFQAWNALCAAGLVAGCGGEPGDCIAALEHISGVPGRLQLIGHTPQGGAVFVDYAHKPDALKNVLATMRDHVTAHGGRLGVVVGCGGNRDKGKRPIMGRIAEEMADWAIITDDNPRNEEPATIRAEVLSGCASRAHVEEIGDRGQAIAAGIAKLGKGDAVIIAGKGHEPGQIIGDKVLHFDDAEEARKNLGLSA
jgi:UDP-N-acetylmuramoyl-L-alanyl-D-glutamate--2,6-diaminopimelate ligase